MIGDWLLGRNPDKRIAKELANRVPGSGYVRMKSETPRDLMRILFCFLLGILIVIAIWGGFAWYFNEYKNAVLGFPTPIETFERLYQYIFEDKVMFGHTIFEHMIASIRRWMTAFLLAAAFGLIVGSLIGYFTKIYSIAIVPVMVFQMIPGLAWLPIALLLFGLGDDAAIFIIFVVAAMVITVNVCGGIRMVPDVTIRASKMMGASRTQMFIKVLIPFATVDILNGLRLGMSSAWRVLIAAEMLVGTGIGLGYAIELSRDLLDYVGAFTCIVMICAIGLLVDKVLFSSLERYVTHKLGMEERN